jgi:hypothetical protein
MNYNLFLSGGGRRCQEKDCHKLDKGGGYCVAHGREGVKNESELKED